MGASHCAASWPVVWAWTGSSYADASIQYKVYYEQKLAFVKKQIAAAEGGAQEGKIAGDA